MKQKTSAFVDVINQFYEISDFDKAKEFITQYVTNSNILPSDKRRLLVTIEQIDNLISLQRYITNSMLKYMGMGL